MAVIKSVSLQARVLVTIGHFHSSLIFAGKAVAYLSYHLTGLHSQGRLANIKLGWMWLKHSSLQRSGMNYVRKSYISPVRIFFERKKSEKSIFWKMEVFLSLNCRRKMTNLFFFPYLTIFDKLNFWVSIKCTPFFWGGGGWNVGRGGWGLIHIRHLWRKIIILSCNRCLISV